MDAFIRRLRGAIREAEEVALRDPSAAATVARLKAVLARHCTDPNCHRYCHVDCRAGLASSETASEPASEPEVGA